jgi:Uma2 family endonuclease
VTATAAQKTVEAYLEFEKSAEVRHEFVDGSMLAMAGSSLRHNEIIFRIRALLTSFAQAKKCVIATESLRVMTKATRYRYPDVVVSCAPQNDECSIDQPCFIAEVLSESTANTDNNAKLEEYTRLPSLQRYAIIAQDVRRVIVYKRNADGWGVEILEAGEIDVPCLETKLSLDQIYAGLEFSGSS